MIRKLLKYLFAKKLGFFLVNVSAIIVSVFTIVILSSSLITAQGEVSYVTLAVMVINSLFLLIKTTLNIFSIIVEYNYYEVEEAKISERVKLFKELLDKEDFRL